MTESVTSSSDAAAQRAAEQARLRKERREAKIKAGGTSRLDKITGIGGRVVGDHEATPTPEATQPRTVPASAPAKATAASATHGDPDEVDISEHYYKPETSNRIPAPEQMAGDLDPTVSEAQLRQMMLGFDRANTPGAGGVPGGMGPGADDPIMKMMTQMMGGGGLPGAEGAGAAGANPFAGMMPQQQQQQAAGPDIYITFWRLLHALVALGLGVYIVLLTPFTGTKLQRETSAVAAQSATLSAEQSELDVHKRNFFWAFATAEAVLLTTRFFLDKGRAPPSGIAWTVAGYLPEPWKGYLGTVLRYGQIFTTVRSDILGCMFVLGVFSLLR